MSDAIIRRLHSAPDDIRADQSLLNHIDNMRPVVGKPMDSRIMKRTAVIEVADRRVAVHAIEQQVAAALNDFAEARGEETWLVGFKRGELPVFIDSAARG